MSEIVAELRAEVDRLSRLVAERQQPAPTMTPETREELARAMMGRQVGRSVTAEIWCMVDEQNRKNWLRFVDAIAPIIERLVAERVAGETERCAKTLVYGWFKCDGDYTRQLAAIRSATR